MLPFGSANCQRYNANMKVARGSAPAPLSTRVDRFGRVVIPKAVRDKLGLRAGDEVEVEVTAEGIEVRPVRRRGGLVEENGLLVWDGELDPSFDVVEQLDKLREAHERDALGGAKT